MGVVYVCVCLRDNDVYMYGVVNLWSWMKVWNYVFAEFLSC